MKSFLTKCLSGLVTSLLLIGYVNAEAANESHLSYSLKQAEQTSPRLIVLDVGLLEILAALGLDDNLALIPEDPAFTGQYKNVQRYRSSVNGEYLMLLQPEIMLGGNLLRDSKMMTRAELLGVETHHIDRALPIDEKVRRVAALFGLEKEGDALIQKMAHSLQTARVIAAKDTTPPRVLHLSNSGAGGQVAIAGRNTPAYELIKQAGGENLDDMDLFTGYKPVTSEGLIKISPEAIVVSDLELEALGGKEGIWRNVAGLSATPAGMNHKLIVVSHKGLKNGSIETATIIEDLAQQLSGISLQASAEFPDTQT